MTNTLIRNARMAIEIVAHELKAGRMTTKAQRAEALGQLENAIQYLTAALPAKEPS